MCRLTMLVTVFLAFAFLNPAGAQDVKAPEKPEIKKDDPPAKKVGDEKGKDDKTKDDKGKDDKKNPKPATPTFHYDGTFGGKLLSIAQNGELTIQYTQKVPVQRASYPQEYFNWQQSLSQRYGQYLQEKNPQTKYNHLIEYQKLQAKPPVQYEIKDFTKDVIVKQAKDMKIRVVVPELQYDDKGKIVAFTKEKLKALQGPEGYPGFPAEVGMMQTNQYVQVYMVKAKSKEKDSKGKDDKKKGPDISDIIGGGAPTEPGKAAPTILDENWNGPRVTVIVIRNDLMKQ